MAEHPRAAGYGVHADSCQRAVAALQGEVDSPPATPRPTRQPGLGPIVAARVLAEFGDDPTGHDGAGARKNYADASPITRAAAGAEPPTPATSTTTGQEVALVVGFGRRSVRGESAASVAPRCGPGWGVLLGHRGLGVGEDTARGG